MKNYIQIKIKLNNAEVDKKLEIPPQVSVHSTEYLAMTLLREVIQELDSKV